MKNQKTVLLLCVLLAIGLIASLLGYYNCYNEKQMLLSKIDSIGISPSNLKSNSEFLKKPEPFPDQDEAEGYTNTFRSVPNLSIPLSVRFKSSDLNALDDYKPYVRFYFAVKPNTNLLTLIAVGVNAQNVDDDAEITLPGGGTVTKMYEFADPCPPCKIANLYPQRPSLLCPDTSIHTIQFHK